VNLPPDTDRLTLDQASALYAELEQRAASLAVCARPQARRARRRWAVLALPVAGLAACAALVLHPAPASSPGAATSLSALGVPAVPGQRVQSVARAGRSVTVTYRSGLIESVGPGGRIGNGVMIVPGGGLRVTVGGRRVLLSGLDPSGLRMAAARLVSRGGSSPAPSPIP
jgi:hypothetical protein